uniref:RNA polymerase I-specific transcription initiation factor RRN3 n=2 Tax=Photinus pyralis TaxID=7054 RepID=A0A1Y1MD29_PHOPY
MSVISGGSRNTSTSSILKRISLKTKLFTERSPTKVRFTLPHSQKVRNILQSFAAQENRRDYESLVCLIRDSLLLDEDLTSLLSEASECISILNQDLRLFVEAILLIKWVDYSESVVSEYQSFIINLLSAHNYHAKLAIDSLVYKFLPDPEEPDWENGVPNLKDLQKFVNVHCVINTLINIIPMSQELLLQSLISNYPYLKRSSHMHEVYLHNILCILDYRPQIRGDLFHLIFSKLVLLDVNAPREDIERKENEVEDDLFKFDDASQQTSCDKMKHNIAHTLDICLYKIFNQIMMISHESGEFNWDQTKSLYQDLLVVFDKVVLPTYNIHHVPFVMFFLCSLKPTIAEAFLNFLWRKVCNPNVPSIHRHSAVSYMASLVARASFVPLYMLKGTLQEMANWIFAYMATQDGHGCINTDIRIHVVFYSVCQALFYIIAFRYKDLVNKRKDVIFLENLNLGKIVTSTLNPLRVCQPAIVQNFASVARTYQLAYCYAVIEHNSRNIMPVIYQDDKGSVLISNNILDSFFPFDPLVLKRSKEIIEPIYLYYKSNAENAADDYDMVEKDDFLLYGTSPGFKHRN